MLFACSKVVWLRGLLGELHVSYLIYTFFFFADNTSAIYIHVFHKHTKYIEMNSHSIREALSSTHFH